jgi:hypothetical protein
VADRGLLPQEWPAVAGLIGPGPTSTHTRAAGKLSPEALRNTLDRIAETPYTRFLVELDGYRAEFRAETDRAIRMRSLSSERLVAVKETAAG